MLIYDDRRHEYEGEFFDHGWYVCPFLPPDADPARIGREPRIHIKDGTIHPLGCCNEYTLAEAVQLQLAIAKAVEILASEGK